MNKRPQKDQNTQVAPPAEAPSVTSSLKSLWLGTCARYTVLCLVLLVTSAIASESLTVTYVDTLRFFLILPFAFCVTVGARIRKADKLATGLKCILHPLTVLGGFYLFGYLPFQVSTKPSAQQVLLMLLLAAIVYGILVGVLCLLGSGSRRKKDRDTPYVSQFGKK